MKKLSVVLIIFILLSCTGNDKQESPQNGFIENSTVENTILIDEKLNLIIPEIGKREFKYLFSFEKVEFAKNGYGYDELLERLKNSYLMIPVTKSKDWEEAVIFDRNGMINVKDQFYGIVPHSADGPSGDYNFVVIGKYLNQFDDEYYASMVFTDEIIVTFDNYISKALAEEENIEPLDYKYYVYFKIIK